MLSPLRESVYAASARTLSGSLAEMERVLGDALYAGYVGYNGRAPGSAVKKEDLSENNEKNKSGGDARHTLVAYFEIVELASILGVDKETSNLAVRIFRHTANNTSLRNRNVESLATAAFVSAAESRWLEYQERLKERESIMSGNIQNALESDPEVSDVFVNKEWPMPPKQLTTEEIAAAANLDINEVLRNLKVVNVALRKQRPENSSSITTHMPTFCRRLELPNKTCELAVGIAEKALQKNICSRRNPISISAAAIYLACQLDGVRKTQTEICRATTLTEVTLRKVYKELNQEHTALLPEWYGKRNENNENAEETAEDSHPFTPSALRSQSRQSSVAEEATKKKQDDEVAGKVAQGAGLPSIVEKGNVISLVPPPLPPGFQSNASDDSGKDPQVVASTPAQTTATATAPLKNSNTNTMLAMLNNPTVQAIANAISMMPQLMPPPPPPLPPSVEAMPRTDEKDKSLMSGDIVESVTKSAEPVEKAEDDGAVGATGAGETAAPLSSQEATSGTQAEAQGVSSSVLAGMQSMVNMMQAMQAIQSIQPQAESDQNAGAEAMNPFSLMAMAMTQAQQGNGGSNEIYTARTGQTAQASGSGGSDLMDKTEDRGSEQHGLKDVGEEAEERRGGRNDGRE